MAARRSVGTVRLAVFGGPYSNPYALKAFLDEAAVRRCDRLFCLGDLGGFGAEPEALWALLDSSGVECIAGNYDVAIGRGDPDCGCGYRDPQDNHFAQIAYDYTRAHVSDGFAAWMRALPTERRETIAGVKVHLVHGSPLGLNDFFWESLPDAEVQRRLAASGADVVLCTHSGLPWQRRVNGRLIVNVGVLGRPANDGRREVWYAVVDLAEGEARAELVALPYDWTAQAASMRAAGLPDAFVETIETGWWTTCLQVLPPFERSQGRFQLYRSELEPGEDHDGLAGAEARSDRPVVSLFGSALLPRRMWVTDPSLGTGAVATITDEALHQGFVEVHTELRGGTVGPPGLTFGPGGWYRDPTLGSKVAEASLPVGQAKRLVVEQILTEGQATGRLPRAYGCAP